MRYVLNLHLIVIVDVHFCIGLVEVKEVWLGIKLKHFTFPKEI